MPQHRYWRRYQRFSEWEDGVVRLAVEAGYVTAQIARMIGRSPDSVSRHCKIRGIARSRARRPAKAIIVALMLSAGVSYAHEPSEPFSEWMMSLKRPDMPTSACCGPADQIYVDEYHEDLSGVGFVASVGGRVIFIPRHKIIWDRVNPTGRGVLFWSPYTDGSYFIFCFVPGSGT